MQDLQGNIYCVLRVTKTSTLGEGYFPAIPKEGDRVYLDDRAYHVRKIAWRKVAGQSNFVPLIELGG